MPNEIERGKRALDAADWEAARDAFTKALDEDAASADAMDGLSEALWWLGDWSKGRELRERAFTKHRAMGHRLEAARAALWIANEHLVALGNRAAWNGWLERAAGLLQDVPPCSDHGWLIITRGRRAADVNECARACMESLEIARRHGDVDLEVFALSQLGRSLVAIGRVDEGFARLDEAMVAVTAGEPRSFFAICDTCCNMLTTCESTVEMERLTQWCRATDDVSRRLKGLTLFAMCRFAYASVLIAMGRWEEADKELRSGIDGGGMAYPTYVTNHVITKLAELRVMQGRLAEAEELLAGNEEAGATRAVASLRLAKGEPDAAARLIERRLLQIESDVVQSAALLSLLVDALLAAGDVEGAAQAAARLDDVATLTKRAACLAAAKMALGLVALARTQPTAWALLDDARERFASLEMPFHAARARLAVARALKDSDPEAARETARGARADFERLGAARDVASAAELLRELGVGGGPGKRSAGLLSTREDEVLALVAMGLSNAEIGRRLYISPKTVEHHVGKILAKLGLKSRAAAAAYVTRQRAEESGRK
jgi:DNA-binding NarL/FixJ family response regulator